MTDSNEAEYTRANLEHGIATLGQQTRRPGEWSRDVSQDTVNYQLQNQVAFLTGYVSNLLDRIEQLEK